MSNYKDNELEMRNTPPEESVTRLVQKLDYCLDHVGPDGLLVLSGTVVFALYSNDFSSEPVLISEALMVRFHLGWTDFAQNDPVLSTAMLLSDLRPEFYSLVLSVLHAELEDAAWEPEEEFRDRMEDV